MSFSVVIPFRENVSEPARTNSFRFVNDFWKYNYDCEIIYSDSNQTQFNRSEARNNGVKQASCEQLVICDADTFCDIPNIPIALNKLDNGSSWVLPFKRYYRLSEQFSKQVVANNQRYISKPYYDVKFVKNSWSGVVCLTKEMFDEVGGYNEQYQGWGFEDYEFKDKLDKRVGLHERVDGGSYHLWHEVEPRSTKDSNLYGMNAAIYEYSKNNM